MSYAELLERFEAGTIEPDELDRLRAALQRADSVEAVLAAPDPGPREEDARHPRRLPPRAILGLAALTVVVAAAVAFGASYLFDRVEDEDADSSSNTAAPGKVSDSSLSLISSHPSDDVEGGQDGTSRLNLQSYQRAATHSYGETIRQFLMRSDSKAMDAYYLPKDGYDSHGNARADVNADGTIADINQWQPVSWTGAHWEANDHKSVHGHWSVEVPDSTGALQTRLEVSFADPEARKVGLDKTWIRTNLADFVVRATNDQMLRLSAPAGDMMPIDFNHSSTGAADGRRWQVRTTDAAESGADAGTDFQIVSYSDNGDFLTQALTLQRSTGAVVLGSATPTRGVRLDVNGSAIRIRKPKTISSSSSPGAPGQISWDSNYLYVCVGENTWTRLPLARW